MHFLRTLFMAGAAAAALCAQAAAQKFEAGDADIARPGGVYTSLTVADPDTCANLCANDGICVAWTYLPGGMCELKAVAPAPVRSNGARSGLSVRASASIRASDAAELRALTPPPVALAAVAALHQSAPNFAPDDDTQLLGGANDDSAPDALRSRQGSAGTW